MKHLIGVILSVCFIYQTVFAQENIRALQRGTSWDDFVYPTITIIDKDHGTTEGSRLVKRIIPDLETFINDIAKGVCQTLYKDVNEVPHFEELIFELEHREGVAYKAGNSPRITINLSTKYLEDVYAQNGDEAILYEIAGVNWHELTHAYQHVPQNAGGYNGGTEFFGFIEGSADAVRILAGYHNTRSPYEGGHWNDGYTTTGFFIEWVQKSYDQDFLYKLNQSCLTIDPWNFDEACETILGKSVADLWNEYQWYLKGGDNEAVAQFNVSKKFICKGESVTFTNRSFGDPESYLWNFTGGNITSSTDVDPVVTYETPGVYDVSLTATNGNGSTTKEQKAIITVADIVGTMLTLTEPDGLITTENVQPFYGEEADNLLDDNAKTKFCIPTGSVWIQYECNEEAQLFGYSLTSASDADWRDPQNWTLSGSNDEMSWEQLDQQSSVVFEQRHETQLFTVDNNAKYRYYRFELSAQQDTMFQLADMVLYGVEEMTTVAITNSQVSKSSFSMQRSGDRFHLSNNFQYRTVEIYNPRGMQVASFSGDAISEVGISVADLARGCYFLRVNASNGVNGNQIFTTPFIR